MQSLLAIADPTRRRIVELLAVRERTAGELVDEFDMSAPAISQHLKVLREAGLVTVRAEGQSRVQSLNPEGFGDLEDLAGEDPLGLVPPARRPRARAARGGRGERPEAQKGNLPS